MSDTKPDVTLEQLLATQPQPLMIDVRKPAAQDISGLAIPDAIWRHPFDALTWHRDLPSCPLVVFCVHGHEVSQAVTGYLRDEAHDARYLVGGFEAWRAAEQPVAPL